ncbi:SusC/RagA family TonB-linked outer membrane protein [Labilibacter marinus]|uniref:SusC/RagA family TonB-linked outer membrane protein n=1 Tax=Labilibacter marinus TaxID=1477105 RepID=UPI00095023AB|nr:SusC/RagA family TonB-linked outer membrane protein [Labilibacter marinus]
MKKYLLIITVLLLSNFVVDAQTDSLSVQKETVKLPYADIEKDRVVGAVDVIYGDDVRRSGEYRVSNSLAGLASGMYVNKYAGQPGANWSSLNIRGRARGGRSDYPMVVIDGIPNRSMDNLPMESIESIQVLKDITAKMLYGSDATNGVILVTTKRGYVAERKLSFSAEGGIKTPTAMPEYLDSPGYARLFDQARVNDGLDAQHTEDEYAYYTDGNHSVTYPNVDLYDLILKDFSDYQRFNAVLEGGDEKTKYFLNMEYVRETGLEKVGVNNTNNIVNLMSNLDYEVNDVVSVSLDISSRMGVRENARLGSNDMMADLSTQRPNDFPTFVTADGSINKDSLGYHANYNNVYGDLTRWGYRDTKEFRGQTTFGIDFNLDKFVTGLDGGISVGFDAFRTITSGKNLQYSRFEVIEGDTPEEYTLNEIGDNVPAGNEVKVSDNFYRNVVGTAFINYDRTFGKHAITSNLVYAARTIAYKGTSTYSGGVRQDDKNINLGLRANYAFDGKYVVEGTSSLMGSDKFAPGNRYGLFGSVGAGWILSNENFMANSSIINYLKIKGSYGVMGYDRYQYNDANNTSNSFEYYKYIDEYQTAGSVRLGEDNSGPTKYGTKLTTRGNEDYTFEKSREINVGIEATLFKNLSLELNYFDQFRYDMPTNVGSVIPSYYMSVSPKANYEELSNTGVDMSIQYSNKAGDFSYSIGGNFMYSESKWEKLDEISEYDHLLRTGTNTDAIWGWVYDGVYNDQADIDNYGVSTSYGNRGIVPGDLKLKDIANNREDDIIDGNDVAVIGNAFPRINYALNLNLQYKGIELYALGQGVAGLDKMLTNSYYMPYGTRKYSDKALADDYPTLTSVNNGHSFRNSSYWMEDGSYFKLRVLELSYLLPTNIANKISADKVRFYVKGTDLFSISKIKDLDPEDINAGVSKYPMFTTYSLGLKVTF